MRRATLLSVVAASLSVSVAGCSGTSDEDSTARPSSTAPSSTARPTGGIYTVTRDGIVWEIPRALVGTYTREVDGAVYQLHISTSGEEPLRYPSLRIDTVRYGDDSVFLPWTVITVEGSRLLLPYAECTSRAEEVYTDELELRWELSGSTLTLTAVSHDCGDEAELLPTEDLTGGPWTKTSAKN
jgi:hypothetical protein